MKKVNFIPRGSTVLVELPEISEKTESGIIKPQEMIDKEKQEHDGFLPVVAAGEDSVYKVGDLILSDLTHCSQLTIDGVIYGYVPQNSILGKRPKK